MAPTGIRYRPPEIAITPEARWLLLRAFGPPNEPSPLEVGPVAALELARAFELSPRVAVRQGAELLASELGTSCAQQFVEDRRSVVFATLQRLSAARDLARVAAPLEIPVVLLKFLALHFGGMLEEGSRDAADIDVLIAPDSLDALYSALCDHGYLPRDEPPAEHHPPPLDHPTHGPVELHRFIPGVSVRSDTSLATADALASLRLLTPIPELPGRCRLPAAEIQVAHVLAHGIAQHGAHPDAYPTARMLADLIDLGFTAAGGNAVVESAHARIERAVSPEEVAAARDLCRTLAAGRLPGNGELLGDSPEGLLLRHILAGILDRDYRSALNLKVFTHGLTDREPAAAIATIVKTSLFPTRGQIDKIHGSPTSRAGYLGRRLLRPLALLGRLLQNAISLLRLKLRRRK